MLVVNSSEFRQNQKIYLDLIDNNEKVIIKRGNNKAYKIVPIENNPVLLSISQFKLKIKESAQQAEEGKISILTKEEQSKLLEL